MSEPKTIPQKTKKEIDWREVEQRMEASRVAIERIWAPTDEDIQRILRERAKTLAREAVPAETVDASIEVIEFLLAHERYAIASEYVRGVDPLEVYTSTLHTIFCARHC